MPEVTATTPSLTTARPRVQQEKNKKFANDGSYASVARLIDRLTWKFYARIDAMGGLGMTVEDVRQTLNLAYLQAHASWKPDSGARFATYCQTACQNNFNAAVAKRAREREVLGMVNLSEMAPQSEDASDDFDLLEHLNHGDNRNEPTEVIEQREAMYRRLASLSLDARRVVSALMKHEMAPRKPAALGRDPDEPATVANGNPPLKFGEVVRELGIKGDDLKRLKLELLKTFDVKF